MAIRYVSLTCDKCGATLTTTSDRAILYCEHCGNKIYVSDSNTKTININKTINEKKYTHQTYEDKAKIEEQKTTRFTIVIVFILMLICLIIPIFGMKGCLS